MGPSSSEYRWRRRIQRLLIAIVLLVVVLAAIGRTYEVIAERRAIARCPMIGRLVDVGGYRLYLDCTGQGSPAVILESGALDSSRQWQKVQPAIAHITRVCSYDRAGFGWSDPGPAPLTAHQMAIELHTLLTKAGVNPPYVVVGHSFGGLVTQIFSSLYPDDVAGVVLDDSVHPDETVKFPDHFPHPELVPGLLRLTVPLGLPRFLGWCNQSAACPDCEKYTASVLAEYASYSESHLQATGAGNLGNKPLAVLAHDPTVGLGGDRDDAFEKAWSDWQNDLAQLSTNSSLVTASGIGHEIQTEQPQLVISAILKIVADVRQHPSP